MLDFHIFKKQAIKIYERLPPMLKHGTFYVFWSNFLRESEFWDDDRIKDYQFSQFKQLLKHSARYIPYYRKIFSDYSLNTDRIHGFEDLKSLPLLDKETIRDRFSELIDERHKKVFIRSTSGSTGIPLIIYLSAEAVKIYHAFLFNSFERVGYKHSDRVVKFWNRIEIRKGQDLPYMKTGNKLILSNRYLSDDWLIRYSKMIKEFKARFITGYPSVLSILAASIKNHDINFMKEGELKAVICHGETLNDWQRSLIGEVFKTRVFSVYSMTEGSLFASECEKSISQHIYPQSGYVEFIDLGDGYKEVVATGFINYAMPLIRYRTGDLVSSIHKKCNECGRNNQLLRRIEGRINDFLIDKKGRVIPRLMPWIKIFPNTKQYQFFQQEPGKAYLRIIKGQNYSDADTHFIRCRLNEMLGPMKDAIDIEIEFTDEIPRLLSCKFNLVDQRLNVRDFLKI